MAKGRFGSGAGEIKRVDKGRLFRGAPRKATPNTNVITTNQQKQRLEKEISNEQTKINSITAKLQQLNPVDGRISNKALYNQLQIELKASQARIIYLRNTLGSLPQGQVYSNLDNLIQRSREIEASKKREEIIKRQDVKARRQKSIREEKESRERGFQQLEGGKFKSQGITFDKEGRILDKGKGKYISLGQEQVRLLNQNYDEGKKLRQDLRKEETINNSIAGKVASSLNLQSRFDQVTNNKTSNKQFLKDVRTGSGKVAVSLIEGTVNLATSLGTRKIGDKSQKFDLSNVKAFNIGRNADTYKLAPIRTGTVVGGVATLSVPIIISGGAFASSVKAVGIKEALLGGVASFSPLRLAPGTYSAIEGAKASKTVFKVQGQSYKIEAGTVRTFRGTSIADKSVKVSSAQIINTKGTGLSSTKITAPTTTITSSGKTIFGSRTIRSYDLVSGTTGKLSLGKNTKFGTITQLMGKQGFAGPVQNIKTIQTLVLDPQVKNNILIGLTQRSLSYSGGVSEKQGDITKFVSGIGSRQFKFNKNSGLTQSLKVSRANVIGIERGITEPYTISQLSSGSFKPVNNPSSQETLQVSSQLLSGGVSSVTTPKINPSIATPITPLVLSPQKNTVKQETRSVTNINELTRTNQGRSQDLVTTPVTKQENKILTITQPRTLTTTTPVQDTGQLTLQRTKYITPQITKQELSKPQTPYTTPITIPPSIKPNNPIGFTIKQLPIRTYNKASLPSFTIFGRRQGIFRPIGKASTTKQALSIGTNFARTTLGSTFKIKGLRNAVGIPRGFYSKPTSQGTLFIEKRNLRLNTSTEIKSIQNVRRKKKWKKKIKS